MANESIISIPASLEDPVVLRRVLGKIVESLDIAIGTRSSAEQQYITQEVFNSAINTLDEAVATITKRVQAAQAEVPLDQQQLQDLLIATSNNTNSITVLQQAVALLVTRVTDLEDDVDDLTTRVEDLETALSLLTNRVQTLEATQLVWLGAWSAGAYSKNSIVKDAGVSWVALVDTSDVPGVSSDWESMV